MPRSGPGERLAQHPPQSSWGKRSVVILLSALTLFFLIAAILVPPMVHAVGSNRGNLIDLVKSSRDIVVGEVESVRDGVDDKRVPYTEITLRLRENIRGDNHGETVFFRQYGLQEPRKTATGNLDLRTTPVNWPRYRVGESVLLFLSAPARDTGLRTTVGHQRGKMKIAGGLIANGDNNTGLFNNISVAPDLLSVEEKRMLASRYGQLDADEFLNLLRRAVNEQWIETGKMKPSNQINNGHLGN